MRYIPGAHAWTVPFFWFKATLFDLSQFFSTSFAANVKEMVGDDTWLFYFCNSSPLNNMLANTASIFSINCPLIDISQFSPRQMTRHALPVYMFKVFYAKVKCLIFYQCLFPHSIISIQNLLLGGCPLEWKQLKILRIKSRSIYFHQEWKCSTGPWMKPLVIRVFWLPWWNPRFAGVGVWYWT